MNSEDKFDFSYSAPTEEERREIESIKRQYTPAPEKEEKLEKLRSLNNKVTKPPMVAGISIGIAGALIMGLGMTMVIEWDIMLWGVIVGVLGLAVAGVAYPIYRAILQRNKNKYGQKILELSDELLNKQK